MKRLTGVFAVGRWGGTSRSGGGAGNGERTARVGKREKSVWGKRVWMYKRWVVKTCELNKEDGHHAVVGGERQPAAKAKAMPKAN